MKWLLVAAIALCNTLGDVCNTAGMKRWGELHEFSAASVLRMIAAIFRNPLVLAGLAAMAISFFALLKLYSIANVSFAVPASASSFLFETLLAKLVLKEDVGARRWLGAVMVAAGVALLSL